MFCSECHHVTFAVDSSDNCECLSCGHRWSSQSDPAMQAEILIEQALEDLEWIINIDGCLDLEEARTSARSAFKALKACQALRPKG